MWSFIIGSGLIALASAPGLLLLWQAAKKRQEQALQTAAAVARRHPSRLD